MYNNNVIGREQIKNERGNENEKMERQCMEHKKYG